MILNTVAERVKAAREHFKESQQKFAERIIVGQSFLSDVENGKRKPSKRMLQGMRYTYGIREEWITDGTGEMLERKEGKQVFIPNRKLLRKIIYYIEDCLLIKDMRLDPDTKAGVILSFWEHLMKFNDLEEREIQKIVGTAIELVVSAVKED
jgi:transcriptional regulator with XRE-family HTH domain